MKNLYLPLLLTALAFTQLCAQPLMTSSITPSAGDNWDIVFFAPDNFDPGPGGANQTWDFSSLNPSNPLDLNFEILDPATVQGNVDFPDAEFVLFLPTFGTYEFYAANADSIYLLGGVSISNNEVDFLTIFTDPEDGIQLPLTYGDNYPYFSAFEQYLFGSFLTSETREGNVNVDGYGTLITPAGTFTNVLRLQIVETSFGITNTQIAWMDVNNFIPLLLYEFSDDPYEGTSLYYSAPDITINTVDQDIQATDWTARYIPAEHQIQLELALPAKVDHLQLQLSTLDGRVLQNQSLSALHPNPVLEVPATINCSNLVVSLKTGTQISSRQITVCR